MAPATPSLLRRSRALRLPDRLLSREVRRLAETCRTGILAVAASLAAAFPNPGHGCTHANQMSSALPNKRLPSIQNLILSEIQWYQTRYDAAIIVGRELALHTL